MTLLDGTEIKVGDKVLAKLTLKPWSKFRVIEILKGGGVDRALLQHRNGTLHIRSRYRIKALPPTARGKT